MTDVIWSSAVLEVTLFVCAGLLAVLWMRALQMSWARFRGRFERFVEERLVHAHLFVAPQRILWIYCALSVATAVLMAFAFGAWVPGIAIVLAMAWLPAVALAWLERRRCARIAAQLPDVLSRMASLLRAGVSIGTAIDHLARQVPPPLGYELRHMQRERRLGVTLVHAVAAMSARVPLRSLRLFSCLIELSHAQGAGMAHAVASLADVSRRQNAIESKCLALTAQARLQARVMSAIPMLVAAVLFLLDPTLMVEAYGHALGKWLLALTAMLQLLGLWWVSLLARGR